MLTIEFETESENGKIKIPEEYRRQLKGKLQVVVSVKEAKRVKEEPSDFISELIKNPIRDPDFVPLKREEIYDRKKDRAANFINWLLKNPVKVDKSIPFLTRDEIYDRKL